MNDRPPLPRGYVWGDLYLEYAQMWDRPLTLYEQRKLRKYLAKRFQQPLWRRILSVLAEIFL